MKIKQTILRAFLSLGFVMAAGGIVAVGFGGATAEAKWCTSVVDRDCFDNLYTETDELADGKKDNNAYGVTRQQYDQWRTDCDNKDGGVVLDNEMDQCANAVTLCMQRVTKTEKCGNADFTSAISTQCNGGKGTDEGCDPLEQANRDDWDEIYKRLEDKAVVAGCALDTSAPGKVQESRTKCREEAINASNTCRAQQGFKSGGSGTDYYRRLDNQAYDKCVNDELLKHSSEANCTTRGGKWDDGKKQCGPIPQANPSLNCNDHGGFAADGSGKCADGQAPVDGSAAGAANNNDGQPCGEAKTVLIPSNFLPGCKEEGAGALGALLKFIVTILTVGVGIVAVAAIVYASILYASAMDNAGQTQQAIGIIRNTVIGIALYIFMISILNWLVPGGVFTV